MREAPRPMPSPLPNISDTAKRLQRIVERPNNRLGDISIGCLVEICGDGSPTWLTGSTVWLPAVFGDDPAPDGDFDVVFSSRDSTETFVKRALVELNRRAPAGQEFKVGTNALGGSRIFHPDGRGVIDVWYTEEDQSIHELLMAYPQHTGNHIRCAYQISRNPTPASLIRIVKEQEKPKPSLLSKIGPMKSSNDSYPGKVKGPGQVIIARVETGPAYPVVQAGDPARLAHILSGIRRA